MYSTKDVSDFFDKELKGLSMQDCIDKVFQTRFVTLPRKPQTLDEIYQSQALSEEAEKIRIELLRRISEELFPKEIDAAYNYVIRLLYRAISESKEVFSITLQKIRETSEMRFPNSLELARLYATGLKFMIDKQERDEQVETLELIRKIMEERFIDDDYIQECYKEGWSKISGCEDNQDYESEDKDAADFEDEDIKPPKIFDVLNQIYAGYNLQLDSDQNINIYFDLLREGYPALRTLKDTVEFVPVRSNKGRIHVLCLKDKSTYSIIWDLTHWELLEKFCYTFEMLGEDFLNLLSYSTDNPLAEVLLYLYSELYTFLSTYNMNYDSDLSEWCRKTSDEYAQMKKALFQNSGGVGKSYVEYCKIYVLHHELEHILWEQESEAENNEINFNTFLLLLFAHYRRVEDTVPENEKIHDYTKEEYLDRMKKLISGEEEKWKSLQMVYIPRDQPILHG